MTDRQFYAIAIFLPLVIEFVLFGTLGIGWVLYYRDYKSTAEWGDSFGFVNALFSGLAFAGVIVAIVIQARELRQAFEEAQTSRVAYQTTAQLQHCSSLIDGIATLSKLQEKLSEESPECWELLQTPLALHQVKVDFEHRVLLEKQIEVLAQFDPTVDEPGVALRQAMEKNSAGHNHIAFTRELYEIIVGYTDIVEQTRYTGLENDEKAVLKVYSRFLNETSSKLKYLIEAVGGTEHLFDAGILDGFKTMWDLDVTQDFLDDYRKDSKEHNDKQRARHKIGLEYKKEYYVQMVGVEISKLFLRITKEFVAQCGYTKVRE